MASVRLRHPNGVSTIHLATDQDDLTVQDLLREIHSATGILPSRQILKSGYPPRPLIIVPELPLTSLGLKTSEQIIVNESSEPHVSLQPTSSPSANTNTVPLAPPTADGPDYVETDGGVLIHRTTPDDNSCLFSSVALVFAQSMSKASEMRKIVADGIRNDPVTFNEAILGMPPTQYIATITKPNSWGGAIELSILATHYRTEIASVDVETGRIDHYTPMGADATTGMRCILVYSGIHYDAASLAPMPEAPPEWHQTLFPVDSLDDDSDPIILAATKLADILRAKKAYTNTSTFDLKCEDCGQGLKGEKGAREHAERTGHVRFGEY